MKRWVTRGFVVVLVVAAVAVSVGVWMLREAKEIEPLRGPRPADWAQPMETAGAPNFFKVSDDLYRGAQPTAEGFRGIAKLGVKTDVNLRSFHSDRDLLGGTGLEYEDIPMKAWHPETEDVVRFLEIVGDPEKTPVFVHCQHGSDRTGTVCAVYRIVVQGWTKEEAIREMTRGGYGFHEVWEDLVDYVQDLDVEALREALEAKTGAKGRTVDTMKAPE